MSDNKTNLDLACECGAYAVPTATQTEPGAAVPMAILFSGCQLDAFAGRVLDDFTAKLAATPALPGPVFEQVAPGVEVGYDMFGGVDIRLGGDFVYVHINYDYRYTHNSARRALADNIVELLVGRSATAEVEIARLKSELEIERNRRWEGNRIDSEWYAEDMKAMQDEIAALKTELAHVRRVAAFADARYLRINELSAEIAALKQALTDIATTVMPSTNDEEHDVLHDCIATAQGALHHTSGSPKPLCTACWGEGWEPSVYDGRRPCGHCVPQAVQS